MWRTVDNLGLHAVLIWLIIYGFTSRSRIFHLYGDITIAGEGLQNLGLWAGRDLYHATPTVTRDLGFSGLILRTTPFSRLLRHTRGYGGSILTRILTGFLIWTSAITFSGSTYEVFFTKHSWRTEICFCLTSNEKRRSAKKCFVIVSIVLKFEVD
jgi:hypothetical protein